MIPTTPQSMSQRVFDITLAEANKNQKEADREQDESNATDEGDG